MLPLPDKNGRNPEFELRPLGAFPPPTARVGPWKTILHGGFCGFGIVLVAVLVAQFTIGSERSALGRGWWLVYPTIYVAGSTAYGFVRWLTRARAAHEDPPHKAWFRRVLAGGGGLLGTGLFLMLAGPTFFHGHGGYMPTQYVFTIVDETGAPVEGVQLHVLGPTRATRARPFGTWGMDDGLSPSIEGSWPLLELGTPAMISDAAGRITAHQPEMLSQWSVYYIRFLGMRFQTDGAVPRHTLALTHPELEDAELALDSLDRRLIGSRTDEVEAPMGYAVPRIESRIVMRRR